jgi:hypothetical protein
VVRYHPSDGSEPVRTVRACPACGAAWNRAARWCGTCGAALEDDGGDAAPARRWIPPAHRVPVVVGAAAAAVLVGWLVVATPWTPGGAGGGGSVDLVGTPRTDGAAAAADRGREAIADGPRCRSDEGTVPCVVWDVAEPSSRRLAVRAVDDLIVSVTTDATVRARSIADGTTRWSVQLRGGAEPGEVRILDEVGATVPVLHGGVVTFLGLDTGDELWSGAPPVPAVEAVAVGAWLVVTDGRSVANLSTVGTSSWQLELGPDERIALGPTGVHLVRGDGTIERRSADGGGVVWSRRIDATVRPLPARAPGWVTLVAVDTEDPFLLGLDQGDGSTRLLLPLDGPAIDAVVVAEHLAVLADGPRGTVLHLATLTDDDIIATGRRLLGTTTTGLRAPMLSAGWVAVAASNPTPAVDVVSWDGRGYRHALDVVPYGVAADGPDALLVATVDGVEARAPTSDLRSWRVQLRSASFVGEGPQHPPVVAHRRGLTRLTAIAPR